MSGTFIDRPATQAELKLNQTHALYDIAARLQAQFLCDMQGSSAWSVTDAATMQNSVSATAALVCINSCCKQRPGFRSTKTCWGRTFGSNVIGKHLTRTLQWGLSIKTAKHLRNELLRTIGGGCKAIHLSAHCLRRTTMRVKSPISSCRFRWIRKMAVAPSSTPTLMDPIASKMLLPVTHVTYVAMAAKTTASSQSWCTQVICCTECTSDQVFDDHYKFNALQLWLSAVGCYLAQSYNEKIMQIYCCEPLERSGHLVELSTALVQTTSTFSRLYDKQSSNLERVDTVCTRRNARRAERWCVTWKMHCTLLMAHSSTKSVR